MKIAVSAASGHLGTEIVKATVALQAKENVIGMARTPDKAKSLGIEIRPGDYNDESALEKSLQSVDTLLLVSGMDAPEKRIEQHRKVIQAAQNSGVKKMVPKYMMLEISLASFNDIPNLLTSRSGA